MDEGVRVALIAALIAVGGLITALVAWLTRGTSTPTPTPTPEPTPTPTPEPTPTLRRVYMAVGEISHHDFFAEASQAGRPLASLVPSGIASRFFEVRDVETRIPSYRGARVGAYGDALVSIPLDTVVEAGKRYFVEYALIGPRVEWREFGMELVRFDRLAMPARPTLPLYIELQFAQIARAHGLPDEGSTFAQRVALARQYIQMLRDHRIEPIKQAVTVYPQIGNDGLLNLASLNWGELVLQGAIAPPCIFGPAPSLPPTTALLRAILASLNAGRIPADSFVYPWDEGEGNTTITNQAIARCTLIRTDAPGVRQVITRRPDERFGSGVEFIAVMNLFNGWRSIQGNPWPQRGGLYVSCMSNGNCQNHSDPSQVGPRTPFPMMVLDAPEHEPGDFMIQSLNLGARYTLYFNSTQRLPTAWEPGGQYNEGGNGDGTLLYPGQMAPVASRRLKWLRLGSYACEWIAFAQSAAPGVTPPNSILDFEEFKRRVVAAL